MIMMRKKPPGSDNHPETTGVETFLFKESELVIFVRLQTLSDSQIIR